MFQSFETKSYNDFLNINPKLFPIWDKWEENAAEFPEMFELMTNFIIRYDRARKLIEPTVREYGMLQPIMKDTEKFTKKYPQYQIIKSQPKNEYIDIAEGEIDLGGKEGKMRNTKATINLAKGTIIGSNEIEFVPLENLVGVLDFFKPRMEVYQKIYKRHIKLQEMVRTANQLSNKAYDEVNYYFQNRLIEMNKSLDIDIISRSCPKFSEDDADHIRDIETGIIENPLMVDEILREYRMKKFKENL